MLAHLFPLLLSVAIVLRKQANTLEGSGQFLGYPYP